MFSSRQLWADDDDDETNMLKDTCVFDLKRWVIYFTFTWRTRGRPILIDLVNLYSFK